MVDLIRSKRAGREMTTDEIEWMIARYAAGEIPDYQMSAWAMAVYFQGMTTRETADLTMAMVHSGEEIDLSDILGVKVDKHSTGGVGDKVSLILVPLVASFGVPVAKMSGRGLGHTGGTLDKLESIPGFTVELDMAAFKEQVKTHGLAIIGQSEDLVKADKLLYALRDVTSTVDIIPLIASSIMSKKIASGSDAILLDVTVGDGAFMQTVEDARLLARTMVNLGNAVGRRTVAVITDMNQPLGEAIGNRNEIQESIQVLQGGGRKELQTFICELAQIMLDLAGVHKALDEIVSHLTNGAAYAKFIEMVRAQHGKPEWLTEPLEAEFIKTVSCSKAGVITKEAALGIGLVAMKLGAGRAVKSDVIDFEAGINLHKKVGDTVEVGDEIATLYSNKPITAELLAEFESFIEIGASSAPHKEILEIID
jgi:pyrimidine-nucleoside phosphorylase